MMPALRRLVAARELLDVELALRVLEVVIVALRL